MEHTEIIAHQVDLEEVDDKPLHGVTFGQEAGNYLDNMEDSPTFGGNGNAETRVSDATLSLLWSIATKQSQTYTAWAKASGVDLEELKLYAVEEACAAYPKFRHECGIRTWAYRHICCYMAKYVDRYGRDPFNRSHSLDLPATTDSDPMVENVTEKSLPWADKLADDLPHRDALSRLIRRETRTEFWLTIKARLTQRQWDVIDRIYCRRLSRTETSVDLSLSRSTIDQRHRAALIRLEDESGATKAQRPK